MLDLFLVDFDWGVVGKSKVIDPEGIRRDPVIEGPQVLDQVLRAFEDAHAHLNLEHEVVQRVVNRDARATVVIPMLHLDGEEHLKVVKRDGCHVGVESVHEEFTFEIDALTRVDVPSQLVVLGLVSESVVLLVPLPADLGIGAVDGARSERLGFSRALLRRLLNLGTRVLLLHDVLFDSVVSLGVDTETA